MRSHQHSQVNFKAIFPALTVAMFFVMALVPVSCQLSESGIEAEEPPHSPTPGWKEDRIAHDGMDRAFRFYIPENLPENPSAVFLFHGGSGGMDQLFRPNAGGTQEWVYVADDEGFILIVPNGINTETNSPEGEEQRWNDCRAVSDGDEPLSDADDTGFVMALTELFEDDYGINPNAVFATGVSNGGMMTYRLMTEVPNNITAGAAVIANFPAESECPEPSEFVPLMIINGTDDTFMPFEGGNIIGDRGAVLSSDESMQLWLSLSGAPGTPAGTIDYPSLNPDNDTSVSCEIYGPAQDEAIIRYCVVVGGGHVSPSIEHTIPGWLEGLLGTQNNDMESAREIWDFFAQFQ